MNLQPIYNRYKRQKEDKTFPQKINKTEWIHLGEHIRLITPIYLFNQIKGYCSFIYFNEQVGKFANSQNDFRTDRFSEFSFSFK